jgi:hypothetical protein
MHKSVLAFVFALLALFAVAAQSQAEFSALEAFKGKVGLPSCVDLTARYRMMAGDRAATIGQEDFNLVVTSLMSKYSAFVRSGEIPDEFLYWKKKRGDDLLLVLLAKEGDACVYATVTISALPDVEALRTKYFPR